LRPELAPGERVIWNGRPGALAFARVMVPRTAFGILFLAILYQMAPGLMAPLWRGPLNLGGIVTAAVGTGFLLLGLSHAMAAPWALVRARWVRYAVTDRRVMIASLWPRRQVRSFAPGELNALERRGRPEGPGDVIFRRDPVVKSPLGFATKTTGFLGVARPREAEAAIAALRAKAPAVAIRPGGS
jgi:hypothetical protein